MNKMPGRLGSLRARDVMCTDLLILKSNMTLDEATSKLKEKKHSGAPVTNSHGKLIGTFSLRDLTGMKGSESKQENCVNEDSAILSERALAHVLESKIGEETVGERMTRNAPSTTENATLFDVARLMCEFHTHRIPVTTISGELSGIITTMDILAAFVHTADELNEE